MYLRPIAKGFVPAVSLLLVAAILCSCGRSRDKAGVHEIEFMNWETSPEGMQLYGKLIKEFEKENPNVRVKNIIVASAYATKLLTRFGGGTPPDIFEIQAEIIHPFLRKNLLLNLSQPIRKSKELNEEDFFPASLVNFRYDGKNFRTGDVYVLPKDMGSTTLVYNKDLFDKAGIPYPDANWSEKEYGIVRGISI